MLIRKMDTHSVEEQEIEAVYSELLIYTNSSMIVHLHKRKQQDQH